VLKALGASAALSPFLPLLNASGQETQPLRLILWFTPHGTVYENWKPSGTTDQFTLGPILAPLERHKGKLNVLDGLKIQADGVGAPHTKGPPLLWTASPLNDDMTFTREDGSGGMHYGWNSAASVDQVIIQQRPPDTPYSSLEFGVRSGGNHPGSRMIYTGAQAPLAPETDPWAAFNRLLGDLGQTTAQLEQLRAERRSVLDLVASELDAVQSQVSSADRHKIEAHLTAVREVEMRLQAAPLTCQTLDLGEPIDANASSSTPVVFDRMIELMATSLACGLTNFASMQYRVGENDGGYTYDWLGITRLEHHLMSHDGDDNLQSRTDLSSIYTWYSERFAYFLDKLAEVPEGDGTMLDNSLVIWGSEIGKGNSHAFEKIPFIVAGGAAGQLVTGRYLEYADIPHNRLLTTVCQLMGLPEVNTFGSTDTGTGPLVGLV
jgi:hypothetical protein